MATQKEIAQELDHSAARAGYSAATGKQCWFLAKLLLEAGDTPTTWEVGYANTNSALTKKKASFMIDEYLN